MLYTPERLCRMITACDLGMVETEKQIEGGEDEIWLPIRVRLDEFRNLKRVYQELQEARARVSALESALCHYAIHQDPCDQTEEGAPCVCGCQDAIKALVSRHAQDAEDERTRSLESKFRILDALGHGDDEAIWPPGTSWVDAVCAAIEAQRTGRAKLQVAVDGLQRIAGHQLMQVANPARQILNQIKSAR